MALWVFTRTPNSEVRQSMSEDSMCALKEKKKKCGVITEKEQQEKKRVSPCLCSPVADPYPLNPSMKLLTKEIDLFHRKTRVLF